MEQQNQSVNFLDFEQPIAELEAKIEELRHVSDDGELNIHDEITRLQKRSKDLTQAIFTSLSAWQISQIARHPLRPYTSDYVSRIFTDFNELHGDRNYADDPAILAGIARFEGEPVALIGHQKGRDIKDRIYRNYGMPKPEGYRKALRIMQLAERFNLPVVTFIDTPGAYPGIGAEERGQSEAIARNLMVMSELRTPVIAIVIGEGGSGGAPGNRHRRQVEYAAVQYLLGYLPRGLCVHSLERRGQGGRRSGSPGGDRTETAKTGCDRQDN